MKIISLILLLGLPLLRAAEPRVLFLGDSITYDGRWTSRVESALRATPEYRNAEIVNLGLPSETVSGLSEEGHAGGEFPRPSLDERLGRVLAGYRPTLVIACYGMNDGIYQPLDPGRTESFRTGITGLKHAVEGGGARLIILTPPLYRPDGTALDPVRYDALLDAYSAWLVSMKSQGWGVVDIRPSLRKSVADAKRDQPGFIYAGDGVHPGDEGHRFIADAACEGLWTLLELPGEPVHTDDAALGILRRRQDLLKLAWLTETKHLRPGIPAGLPLDQVDKEAARLMAEYRKLAEVKMSEWSGYERRDFSVDGRAALLVRPKSAAPGKPWIWRTEFFGHEPQADIALLGRGFHVAYINVSNLYGAPVAMTVMDRFHEHLTGRFGLSRKVVLEGFSRGGLFAFNWAALHPDQVAALYVDAPVCDFKSWPGGKGTGPGSPGDWSRLLKVYGINEEEALAYGKNPVDQLQPLADAGVPILAVIGAADEVVPVSENIDVVEKRYLEMGGRIEVIRKPGGKHHPHSLPDPAPIVDFVTGALGTSS